METNNQNIFQKNKHSKIVVWSVIIAIVIVMNLFFNYATSLVYTEPKYEDFCKMELVNKIIDNKNECVANGGMWSEQIVPVEKSGKTHAEISGYCNSTYTCSKDLESAQKIYNRDVFMILVTLGILVIILGVFVKIATLSIAFAWAGVLSLIIASMRYWASAGNIIRVLILGFALVALIWLVVKKFEK